MKSGLFILIVCLLFPAYVCADTSKHALEENRKLLHSLDSLLGQQDLFVRVKEERIKQLKMQYSRVKDVKELYAMNRMVYVHSIPACGITPVRTPNCRNITIISKRLSGTRYTSQPLLTNCATGTAGHGSTWEPRK